MSICRSFPLPAASDSFRFSGYSCVEQSMLISSTLKLVLAAPSLIFAPTRSRRSTDLGHCTIQTSSFAPSSKLERFRLASSNPISSMFLSVDVFVASLLESWLSSSSLSPPLLLLPSPESLFLLAPVLRGSAIAKCCTFSTNFYCSLTLFKERKLDKGYQIPFLSAHGSLHGSSVIHESCVMHEGG